MEHRTSGCIKVSSQYCSSIRLSRFSKEFILEIDASLMGFSTILCQQKDDGRLPVIVYVSQSLHVSQ